MLFLVFVMGSHILTFSIMMNTVSEHGTCTIVFGVVGLIVSLICCLPRTLHKVSYFSIASFISIIAAVLITMIGVGIEEPDGGKVDPTVHTSLYKGFLSVTNVIFAYAGMLHPIPAFPFSPAHLSKTLRGHKSSSNETKTIQATSLSSPSSPNSATQLNTRAPSSSSKVSTSPCTSS